MQTSDLDSRGNRVGSNLHSSSLPLPSKLDSGSECQGAVNIPVSIVSSGEIRTCIVEKSVCSENYEGS